MTPEQALSAQALTAAGVGVSFAYNEAVSQLVIARQQRIERRRVR